jgi:motility quorum-sensing regulator / GCU-specific mRNA interferase toxin
MEKRRPHYDLDEVKALVADPFIQPFTATARREGTALGLKPQDMREIVLSLTQADFYKSMTTFYDNRVWQDVYHSATREGQALYIKITGYKDGRPPVVSFKKK